MEQRVTDLSKIKKETTSSESFVVTENQNDSCATYSLHAMNRAITDEEQRLRTLYDYAILDTPAERLFDDVAELAATACGTPLSAISLMDHHRQWFKAKIGMDMSETPRENAFCSMVAASPDELFVVNDAWHDVRFRTHPLVLGSPHSRFYAGAPLVAASGEHLGTLCVMDRTPRDLTRRQRNLLLRMAQQVVDVLNFRREMEILRTLSSLDTLTGLHNRRVFDERLSEEFHRARRYGTPLSLMLCDVDHFKRFNDTLGHMAGDRLLHSVARILRRCIRSTDIECRYGGDELAIILPNTQRDVASHVAERFRGIVSRIFLDYPQVTLSIGVAELDPAMKTPCMLLAGADKALYAAKRTGRNQVCILPPV